MISGCNRDHYASGNYRGKQKDQGPNKYNQNLGEFDIHWHELVKINGIIHSSGRIGEVKTTKESCDKERSFCLKN